MELSKKLILDTVIEMVSRDCVMLDYQGKTDEHLAVKEVLHNIISYKENLERNNKL